MSEAPIVTPTLSGIAAILQAVAWPIVAALFFVIYRPRISSLFDVLTKKLEAATKFKAGQLEFETAQEIKDVVEKTGEAGGAGIEESKIPLRQLQAAQEVSNKLQHAPLSELSAASVVQKQVQSLVDEYEQIRAEMLPGPARTRRMNEVAAKMRTLSLAARPLVRPLTHGKSAGQRLAAICILQMAPDFGLFQWLIERFEKEEQAFLLFQAAIAVLELIRAHQYSDGAKVREAIAGALQHVTSFRGGTPDENTINVLNESLSLVR